MQDTSLTTCPENSPNRCTTITSKGQCTNESMEGFKVCALHGRANLADSRRKAVTEIYRCRFQNEIKEFSNSQYMSLRAEVSILRMTLQKLLESCENPVQLLVNVGPISKLTSDISNVLGTMDRINMNSGNLLGPEEIVQLANEIVQAISLEVGDADMLARLAEAIQELVRNKFTSEDTE